MFHQPFDVHLGQLPVVSLINLWHWSMCLIALRILSDKHVVIIAQDAATYKVMDLLDARCTDLVEG